MKHPPNKRNEALVHFSQEHHYGLLLVWKIKDGLSHNIAPKRISDYVLFFFKHDLEIHLNNEEVILFLKLEQDNPKRKRVFDEHQKIYNLIDAIQQNKKDTALLLEFSEVLYNHIRYEERTLFNYIQSQLSESELKEIGETHHQKPTDVSENWKDKFWISKQ